MTQASETLPPIPDKIYFTIGEAARLCRLETHVLRYWEREFPQLKPKKRRNRRYYQKHDILMVRKIRSLMHVQGFTAEGARLQLQQKDQLEEHKHSAKVSTELAAIRQELESVAALLAAD